MTVRVDIRDLFMFRDSPVRWPVAVQAALAMGLPVAIFAAVGQPQLGLMASTGGFTALYLAGRSRRERARLLPLVGVGLFALVPLAHPAGLLLAVLQFIVELVVIRNYGLALVFITPLALIIAAQGQPADVGGVVVTRLLDTLLGAGIAMVVLLVALVVRYPRRPAP